MKYLIEVNVNEDKLRRSRGIDVGEENEYEESIETLIIEETGWVDDSGIYFESIKEVESDVTGEYELPESVWEFVEEYYPGYVNSGQIAIADELQKILDKEDEEGSMARDYFVHDCNEDMNEVIRQYEYVHHEIYKKAILGYLETIKNKVPETVQKLGIEISEIINQDGDDKTDGQCIDEIINLLDKYGLYKKRV